MKILVIQQKMIGDVLVSSIICENLRKAYPAATIDYLVNESALPVLNGNNTISNIVVFETKHQKSFGELIALGIKIRHQKYDLIIDAYSKLQSWVLVLLSGAARKISYKKPFRTFLYTDNVPMADIPKTNLGLAIERRLSLLEPLKLSHELITQPKLFVSSDEQKHAAKLFKANDVNRTRKTVMISLLGSEKLKTYPLEFMARLIDLIADEDVNILFNYFPKQIGDARAIYNLCSETTKDKIYFDLMGTDLREFIAIMNECDLIVGNDGGAINMAKALGKPSFIIFSPWIEKKIWATFEDGLSHTSVHLQEFEPELFIDKTYDELKRNALSLYKHLTPELIIPGLRDFLKGNL